MSDSFSLNFNGKDYLINKKDIKDDTKISKYDLGIQDTTLKDSIFESIQLEQGANGFGGDDSILDALEIKTFINMLDASVDKDNDGKLSDDEINNFMRDNNLNPSNINQDSNTAKKLRVESFKQFFSALTNEIYGNNNNPLQYDSSKPGILQDTTDTNRHDDFYVEVQKWGDEPLDGNTKTNDCLSRIIENYYGIKMDDPKYAEIEKAVMDNNPEIYGGPGLGKEDAGKTYKTRSTISTSNDRHNAILYSDAYNPLREDGGADRIYLPKYDQELV